MSIRLWPDSTVIDTARVWRDAQTQYPPVDAVRRFFAHRADPTDDADDGTVDLDELDGDGDGETD